MQTKVFELRRVVKHLLFILLIGGGMARGQAVNINSAASTYSSVLYQPISKSFRIAAAGSAASIYVAPDKKADDLEIAKSVTYCGKDLK